MSTDQIAFILENCHAAKYQLLPYGIALKFQLHEGDNWQQIEVEASIFNLLSRKYPQVIEKWDMVDSESAQEGD